MEYWSIGVLEYWSIWLWKLWSIGWWIKSRSGLGCKSDPGRYDLQLVYGESEFKVERDVQCGAGGLEGHRLPVAP
jgi:hypothetical protein